MNKEQKIELLINIGDNFEKANEDELAFLMHFMGALVEIDAVDKFTKDIEKISEQVFTTAGRSRIINILGGVEIQVNSVDNTISEINDKIIKKDYGKESKKTMIKSILSIKEIPEDFRTKLQQEITKLEWI